MAKPSSGVDREQVLDWIERVSMFCTEVYGVPPIAGRILGWLMICDPAEQSAGQIAEAIGASRASLVTNMRMLTGAKFVRRLTRPPTSARLRGADARCLGRNPLRTDRRSTSKR